MLAGLSSSYFCFHASMLSVLVEKFRIPLSCGYAGASLIAARGKQEQVLPFGSSPVYIYFFFFSPNNRC